MKCFQLAPLVLLFASPLPDGGLSYQPESGVALQTSFESTVTLEITEMARGISIDGEDHPVPETPTPDFSMTETETIEFTDVVQMEDGVPANIRRSFTEVGNQMVQAMVDSEGEDHGTTKEGESAFQGTVVEFVWDEDDEAYTASLAGSSEDLDEDLLEGLIARADFAGFLPEEELAEGDDWEVPLSAYIAITHLCGDLEITSDDDDEDEEDGDEYNEEFDGNLQGDITATWKETVEEDGERYAVITIKADLSTVIETEEEVTFNDVSGTEESSDSFEFELEGQLYWHLGAGHAHSLNLSGSVEMNRETTQEFDMGGRSLLITEETTFVGTLNYAVSVE